MDFRKPNGTSRRYKKYREENKANKKPCVFCELDDAVNTIYEETERFQVIGNIFPYDIWDGYVVKEHLLIIPKKHTETVADFNGVELREYASLLAKYEAAGYSIYARSPQNKRKTVPHEHTHLLLLDYDLPIKRLLNIKSKFLWYN